MYVVFCEFSLLYNNIFIYIYYVYLYLYIWYVYFFFKLIMLDVSLLEIDLKFLYF